MGRARDIKCMAVTVILLTGCVSRPTAEEEAAYNAKREEVSQCMAKETLAVARQPVDLETASLAVLTRCEYGRDIERSLTAQYPGYRDFIHQTVQKRVVEMQEIVKGNIAVIRTRGP